MVPLETDIVVTSEHHLPQFHCWVDALLMYRFAKPFEVFGGIEYLEDFSDATGELRTLSVAISSVPF